ncbi:MAG: M23 family metallopeptidase [Pseudomonadota bacterium]
MRVFVVAWASIAATAAIAHAATQAPSPPKPPILELPIACGDDDIPCLVQNFVDADAGARAQDAACGAATYDGHKGVDFRLPSLAAADHGVAALAAAPGVVLRARMGEPDRRFVDGEPAFGGEKPCGNGIVIDHGGGWMTQYCHLRRGGVMTAPGARVSAGDMIGLVGSSGDAAFAHLHFSVRFNGDVIDPFDWRKDNRTCRPARGASPLALMRGVGLWSDMARDRLDRDARAILAVGFAPAAVSTDTLERQDAASLAPTAKSAALVAFARFMNLHAGDRILITAKGPEGFSARHESEPLERSKATFVAYAGKRRTGDAWPAGVYEAKASLLRGEEIVETKSARLVLPRVATDARAASNRGDQ